MYQIEFWDKENNRTATPVIDEQTKDTYLEILKANGFEYVVLNRAPKKWQVVKIVFDMQLIPAAKKAAANHEDMDGIYTFGDPKYLGVIDKHLKVECTNGKHRIGCVVGVEKMTKEEIEEFKAKIGYRHLGLTIEQV